MFKMLEVVGIAGEGFSEAVKNAVQQVLASGEKVHFFEVIEERGSVRDGKLKEYQVKIKVAVEMKDAKSPHIDQHYCPTCEQPAGEKGHMCVPAHDKETKCEWCGALIPDERHLCDEKVAKLAYICNTCGRTAVKAEYLCNPKKIDK